MVTLSRRTMLMLILALAVVIFLFVLGNRKQSNMEVMYGKYQEGNTYMEMSPAMYETCKSTCDGDSKCAGFTISTEGKCEFKSGITNIVDRMGQVLYKK